jgi:hypothetical protein
MKSNNKNRVVLIALSLATICILPLPAQAVTGETVRYLKEKVFSFLPKPLLDLVGDDGEIRLENLLTGIYKTSTDTGLVTGKSTGSTARDAAQDILEVANKANTIVHRSNVDEFVNSSASVESVANENESSSDSSLEAADKSNKINAARLLTSQRQIKSTNDLTQAMQIANLAQIEKGQQARVQRQHDDIKANYYANELDRIRASVNNRFYLPGGT